MTDKPQKKSDLGVRAASAVVMLAVAGIAFWQGGYVLDVFIILIAAVAYYELTGLVRRIELNPMVQFIVLLLSAAYVGLAAWFLIQINMPALLLLIVGSVVCVDIFAYFFGRTLGGPKIAPSISPSKTWAGLLGGIVGATLALAGSFMIDGTDVAHPGMVVLIVLGAVIAVVAQSGDFFESWLKRKAGVKDSSNLIPGHGGVFDRVDGLLPVAIAFGLFLMKFHPEWLSA